MKPAGAVDQTVSSSFDWDYAQNFMTAAATTYVVLMLIYGILLAIYHFCVFLPKTRRNVYREEEVAEPDTKSNLIRIAKKHNKLDKTQEEDSIQKTAEGEGTLERTQSQSTQSEITTAKLISKEPVKGNPSKEPSKGNKGSPTDHNTAKSNTSTVVSRRQGKRDKAEQLLLQGTQSDTD